ncbi:ATP-binding cassette domain-containing protein [Vallitalea pronyensis]|uniref:ATP-binding cassette domain-containing protein n=1 Tax=Vallitalea pronyensis TaxID=1348613 RepID=A0A8J8MK94_9FIRM|nr:ATP-binding cassette domain-containing protein [Vallitalea pronyensis]QUI22778.1 ATP-binding cassette domain-containing protein [Vallitalea pronyensis]
MIEVNRLNKSFKVAKRSAGVKASFKSLFHREYTTIHAIRDISFTIEPGEIVGYIGPNGAGKSTTIKVMSGILVPDSGTCRIMGHTPWKDRKQHVKNIGVVFGQRSQLWWDVPVIDSYELLKDIYKIPSSEYKANLHMLTDILQLDDFIHAPVRQLSLGQRMRCEIAASLLHSPRLLFLDEPTIGLDAISKIAVRQFIKRINKEKQVTVILTTHDMIDIEALAHRLLLIGKGNLLYDGNLNDLRGKYAHDKIITLEYAENHKPIHLEGITVMSQNTNRAVISVNTEKMFVSDAISYLSHRYELVDVSIETQPVEDIIVKLYKEYAI